MRSKPRKKRLVVEKKKEREGTFFHPLFQIYKFLCCSFEEGAWDLIASCVLAFLMVGGDGGGSHSLHEVLEVDVEGGTGTVVHALELLDVITIMRPVLAVRHPPHAVRLLIGTVRVEKREKRAGDFLPALDVHSLRRHRSDERRRITYARRTRRTVPLPTLVTSERERSHATAGQRACLGAPRRATRCARMIRPLVDHRRSSSVQYQVHTIAYFIDLYVSINTLFFSSFCLSMIHVSHHHKYCTLTTLPVKP